MAAVVVACVLAGPAQYYPRLLPYPASVLSWHASFLLVPRFASPRATVWLPALGDTAWPRSRPLICVPSSWLASHLFWVELFNYCLSLSRSSTPLRSEFLPYLFFSLRRFLPTSLSHFRMLSCLFSVFSTSTLLILFGVHLFCDSTMADSLLSKLGELTFTAEEQDAVVAIPAEDFACSLVGKVISPPPLMEADLLGNFAPSGETIRTNVLKRGPWDFQKYWFTLEQADPNRTIHDYSFRHMCIWVRIHNIPLSLMTAALACAQGAFVGKVIMTDTRLEDRNMGEFMRVRVSFKTSKPLHRCVVLSRPDAKASLCPLQYERLPFFCHGCGLIGHSVLACPTTPKVEGQKFQYGAWLRAPLPKRSASQPRGRLSIGRATTDNILVAHEIVHTLHTSVSWSSQGAVFKLDMEKAFDRVEWPFLKVVMLRLGFAQSWVDLIMRCVSSVSSRELSAALIVAQREGRLPGVHASKHGPPVNHLLFVDDSLVFLRNDMSEVHCLKDILTTYSTVSGQKVNFSKSTAYFSPRTPSKHRLAVHEALGVQEVSDPGIYLRVPLLIGKNKPYLNMSCPATCSLALWLRKCPDPFASFGGLGRARPVAGPLLLWPISVCLKLSGDWV
ncbi:hypothetical protein GQ457_17G008370 [Hibiscus cannabinus]